MAAVLDVVPGVGGHPAQLLIRVAAQGRVVALVRTEFAVSRALTRFLGDEIQVDRVQVRSDGPELAVDVVYLRKSDLRTERLRVGVPILAAR